MTPAFRARWRGRSIRTIRSPYADPVLDVLHSGDQPRGVFDGVSRLPILDPPLQRHPASFIHVYADTRGLHVGTTMQGVLNGAFDVLLARDLPNPDLVVDIDHSRQTAQVVLDVVA